MKPMKYLLINPPVYDFSAFDLWSKPYGFLILADILKKNSQDVYYFDFMDRAHPFCLSGSADGSPVKHEKKYGTGKYHFTGIEKPPVYRNVPRRYRRFGLPDHIFSSYLDSISTPDFIFITTGMTYWYPGVKETVSAIKKRYPRKPVVLGGCYATFCPGHAAGLGADMIFQGGDLSLFLSEFNRIFGTGLRFFPGAQPCWDVYSRLSYLCVRTTSGCPFSCDYCGIKKLAPDFKKFNPATVAEAVTENCEKFGVTDIAFYDDALLVDFESHLGRILRLLPAGRYRFHTPNGIHVRYVTPDVASALKETGFTTLRLSLEGTESRVVEASDFKVSLKGFESCLKNLERAGFQKENVGIYLLAGLPGQSYEDVFRMVKMLKQYGYPLKLAEYSPIPGTKMFEVVKKSLPGVQWDEPLLHNNSIYPCWDFPAKWDKIESLKSLSRPPCL